MFAFSEEWEKNVEEKNGVMFICDKPFDGCEDLVDKLAAAYSSKVADIAGVMLPEVAKIKSGISAADLAGALGKATVDIDNKVIDYLEQTVDDSSRIFKIKFDGVFEKFSNFSIG